MVAGSMESLPLLPSAELASFIVKYFLSAYSMLAWVVPNRHLTPDLSSNSSEGLMVLPKAVDASP